MRLSELADATGASVATRKFSPREGLLHPGASVTRTLADLASTPGDPAGAVRHVVLGTVLLDPMLAVLRRLAQQDRAIREERERA